MDEQMNQQNLPTNEDEKMASQAQPQTQAEPVVSQEAPKTDASDVEKNKAMAIIGYIIPILFFIPLLNEEGKRSPFAKFHANQQLNLLLFSFIGYTVASLLIVVLIGLILYPILIIANLVFLIMGIINASKGEMKELPIIGKYTILK